MTCSYCPQPIVRCRHPRGANALCRGWVHADGLHLGGTMAAAHIATAGSASLDALEAIDGPDPEWLSERRAGWNGAA